MRKVLTDHLKEFIDECKKSIAFRSESHIPLPERIKSRANRKTKKQIRLATELLICLGAMKKARLANLPDLPTCSNLSNTPFSEKSGELYFVIKTQRKKDHAFKFDHQANIPTFTPLFREADLFKTLEDVQLAITHIKTTPNSKISHVKVKDVMQVVYQVKMIHGTFPAIETLTFWHPKHLGLDSGMFLTKGEASQQLKTLKKQFTTHLQQKLEEVNEIHF